MIKPFCNFPVKRVNLKNIYMKTKILLLGAFLSISVFISCNSDDKTQDTTAITDDEVTVDSNIDVAADDVSLIVEDQYAVQQNLTNKTSTGFVSILPACATITTVLTDGTWTRTIDFGTEGCALFNGNVLKGKIIISFSNNFTSLTRNISYSFVGFYHNGKLIQGNKSIEIALKSTELLASLHPVSTHSLDMSVTFTNGGVYTRTGTRVKEMIEGFNTPANWEDNAFLVSGNHTTSFPNGTKTTSTIISPLRFISTCHKPLPVSGTITITKNDATALLDFGDGTCDNLATITKDNVAKEIHLERKD